MKKRSFFDICTLITKLIFGCMILLAITLLVVYAIHDKGGGIKIDEITYIEHWTVKDGDGRTFETGRSYFAEKEYDKDFTIIATLPARVEENAFLCFPTGKNLSVYIGDELRYTYDEIKDVKLPGGAVKRFFLLIPLSPADSGAQLRLERDATTKNGQVVPVTFVGTQGAIYAHMMHEYGLTFMLAEVIQIFSAIVVLVGVALGIMYRRRINMLYGALGIFVVASWVVVDSFLFPFIFGHYHIDGVVSYMLSLMIPFGPAIYLNAIQHGRHQKSMTAIFLIASANAILWPILHFTGIFPFYEALSYINVFQAVEALMGFFIMIADIVRGKAKEYKYTAIGFVGFILCGLYEVISFLFFSPQQEELPMVVGLAVFLVFVVIQQVEDLRKTYAEKQHAVDLSQAKSRFLASMSHEIRTPINSILGMNEMILRENKDKVIEEYAQTIKSSGNMLLMLVNDVLDFSRIEAGKLEINETQFRLSDVLHDVISLCKERAQEKSLDFQVEIEPDVPSGLISDEFRIRQILVNLLSNAVKYTDKGSVKLTVGAGSINKAETQVFFNVKDTGRGIREEDQKSLFDAFTRADLAKNSSIEGTGLGLAIVHSIVTSMHGTIIVHSEYGVGSTFIVALNMQVTDPAPLTKEALEIRSQDHSHEAKCDYVAPTASILAVDDNQSNLTIARLFLKRTRVQTDFCDGGEKAIQKCKEKKYDLILLDHMMPHPDGVETFHHIREDADSRNKETPVIVLTANAVAGSRQKYLEIGFEDYLTKPLDSHLLEQTIKKFLPKDKIQPAYSPDHPAEGLTGSLVATPTISLAGNVVESAKLTGTSDDAQADPDDEPLEFYPEGEDEGADEADLFKKICAIEGLDVKVLMTHCSDDESIAAEILSDIAKEGADRCERMRKALSDKDYAAYGIDAHAIKGLMATIGLMDLSERAKQQEFAAKEGNVELIEKDGEGMILAYEELCRKLK